MTDLFAPRNGPWVLAARGDTPESRQALSELCAAYYGPVVAFMSRSTRNEEQAAISPTIFRQDPGRQGLDGPQCGRFRTDLLGAVKHFRLSTRRGVA